MKEERKETATRRDFLKFVGTTMPVAAVAVATSGTAEAASGVDEVDGVRSGLQDTAHVRAYYETARF